MLPYLKSLLPRLQQYSKSLDQTSVFIDKPWVMIDENKDYHSYTFHKDGRLIMSLNGIVQIGKWEYLIGSESLLIDRVKDTVLLNQVFIQDGLMLLKKDGMADAFFTLINKKVIPDLDCEKYLTNLFVKKKNLSPFRDSKQKIYYHSMVFNYTNPFPVLGDEIFDEKLESIKDGTIFTNDKTINVVNGKVGSFHFIGKYQTKENLQITILQSANDRISNFDIVLGEDGDTINGCLSFDPVIPNWVRQIEVRNGAIVKVKRNRKDLVFALIALAFVIIIISIFVISTSH